ncbi:MAG TPA: protein phosphatase 2C domain-containing protein [Methylobacter sp.]|jgi:serine/threonine protein phosphatase PrpC
MMSLEPSLLQKHLTAWFLRRTTQNGVRRVDPLSGAVASDIGIVREENQDRVALSRGKDRLGRVFVVAALADGIGGMRDGAECAATTIGCFLGSILEEAQSNNDDTHQWLLLAVQRTNLMVHTKFRGNGGSTLAAVIVREGGRANWLSVGDSRIYGSKDSALLQLSVDDTIAGQLGKLGQSDLDQSRLLQFIGIGESLEPHIEPLDIASTKAVLLTSDGVHFIAPAPDWLGLIVRHASEPGLCVRRLTELSKWCGGPDNASAAMINVASAANAGTAPAYSCLEVWDPFGETQIIYDIDHRQMPSQLQVVSPEPDIQGASVRGSSSVVRNSKKLSDVETSTPPAKKTTARRSRKSKPGEEKESKHSDDKSASQKPELLIEFSNKVG